MSRCNDTCNGPYVGEECSESALEIMVRDRDHWKRVAKVWEDEYHSLTKELNDLCDILEAIRARA